MAARVVVLRSCAAFVLLVGTLAFGSAASGVGAVARSTTGTVVSANGPLAGYDVRLLAAGPGLPVVLGSATSAADGGFTIGYEQPLDPDAVLYLQATQGDHGLWSVLGTGAAPDTVVVNEVTTVATAYAMAQFTDGTILVGPTPGMPNAAAMAHNIADVGTGGLSPVLLTAPNGTDPLTGTRAVATVNALANGVTGCLEGAPACVALFDATTSPEGVRPSTTFQALVNTAHDPWHHILEVYAVTLLGTTPHQPALTSAPPGWTVAIRFDGDGMSLDGPGNVVFDHRGHLWVNNNYQYSDQTSTGVCGGTVLFEFGPDGRFVGGYPGGGLSGAGFGIGRDPYGDIWVGNFGFASSDCPTPPAANSVSQFRPDGTAVSPAAGWTQGAVSFPQATTSNDHGDIWIANCGNDSVTIFPGGDPGQAVNRTDLGVRQPFDIAFGPDGTTFVSGSANDTVAVISPDGTPLPGSPRSGSFLATPMGVATDSAGYAWVANQGVAAPPCPNFALDIGLPSVALLGPDGTPQPGAPFHGGGLHLPFGIAVDGNDNVWVADFGAQRVSQFCGVPARDCRPGTGTGSPISPDVTGYGFDGLTRNTGVDIDPSGNVWLMNNWRLDPLVPNPGGHEIVAFVGMAGPVQPAAPRPRPVVPAAPVAPATPGPPAVTG